MDMKVKQWLLGVFFISGLLLISACSNTSKDFMGGSDLSDSYVMSDSSLELSALNSGSAFDKQKALYATPTYRTPLKNLNAFDIEVSVSWDSLQQLRQFGKNGVYEATSIGVVNGPSGYFGPQVFGNKGKNTKDMILFSFWDGDSMALPINQGIDGVCKRNCQDGFCGDEDNGAKCSLKYPMEAGVDYTMRLRRVEAIATVDSKSGSVWQLSVTNQKSKVTKVVGKMLFVDVNQGIDRMNFFHEHLGLTPCEAFRIKTHVKPKILGLDNVMLSAYGTVIGGPEYSCQSYDVKGDKPSQTLIFETGKGLSPGFLRGVQHPLF
jgi:hypothetical protein